MKTKMYNNSSIENGWSDLAQIFFKMFVTARRRFLRNTILGKYTGKVGNHKSVCQKYNSGTTVHYIILVAIG